MGNSMNRRAALYLRQSLDRAEGIEAQRKRCAGLAESKGWQVAGVFEDNDVRASAPRGEGTAWHKMLGAIGRDFEVIVAVDLDRLVRSTKDLNTLIDLGAQVVTVDGEIDLASADGEFRATMIAGIGRFEARRASERQKRHKAAKAERGEWHGGTPPYGYVPANNSLAVVEHEADLIREAAARLLDDRELMHSIVVDWNQEVGFNADGSPKLKHPTRPSGVDDDGNPKPNVKFAHPYGAHWRQSNLRSILLNRSLLGETKAGVVGWEPILDQRTFDRLHALLTDPSRKVTHSPGVKGGKYSMGGGLTVCGKCGKPLITNTKTAADGSKRPVLSCLRRVHGPHAAHPPVEVAIKRDGEVVTAWRDTGRVSIDHTALERYVFEKVIESLNASDRWRQRMAEGDPAVEEKIDALEAERADLRDQRERAGKAYVLGVMSERDAQAAVSRLDMELEQRDRQLNDLLGRPVITSTIDGDVDWEAWTPGRRRAFLRLLVDRAVVDEWPKDLGTFPLRRRAETDEQFEARKAARQAAGLEQRVAVKWRWDG